MSDAPPLPLPRPLIAVAIGLPVILAIAVAVVGVFGSRGTGQPANAARTGPAVIAAAPAPAAGSPECAALLAALPAELTDGSDRLARRPLAPPAPPAVAAWGNAQHDPVVLRCGIERPAELTPTSHLWQVNGSAQWLQLPGQVASTWVVVDRPVYLALTLPAGTGAGPLQDISTIVSTVLPPKAITFGN